MHVILVTIGTDGDIYPFVGLGAILRARGHAVTLAASADYEPLATANGFRFSALVSAEENHELFDNPDFWHPRKTPSLCAKWGGRFIRRQYDLLAGIATPGSVLVSNPGVFATGLVREKLGVPEATLLLQPWLIHSSIAPPIVPGYEFLNGAPRAVWRAFYLTSNFFAYVLVGRKLNRVRADLGLKPRRRILKHWFSPQRTIGLFPEWYGPPQTDWPPQIRLAGFPMFDGKHEELSPSLLEFCRSSGPPVVFTFGTGMVHSAGLFRTALEACQAAGVRGVFLTKHDNQLPRPLPPSIFPCAFAPFQKLFPLCAAVVHHGGIGTVAKALAAGCPQLIRPICFDQNDNGARVKRLGGGDWLKPRQRNAAGIAAALRELLRPEVRSRCAEIASRFTPPDGLETAARLVTDLAGGSPA